MLAVVFTGRDFLIGVSLGLFPPEVRATGFGLAYNLAQMIFGASAPLACNYIWSTLTDATRDETSSPTDLGYPPLVDAAPASKCPKTHKTRKSRRWAARGEIPGAHW